MPFLFLDDLRTAMRVSNSIALVMLFVIGAQLGRYMGRSPWPTAFAMAAIGAVLVAVTIAFGG
jgi:VIT1/CCC1 family predicted Fe2+/Mn2+ transporter